MEDILNVFGINWKLLLIQSINFGILLLVLYKFLYKPLFNIIEKRKEKIEKGVKDAEAAEEHLQNAQKEKEAILSKAAKDAEEVYANAKKSADRIKEEMLVDADHKKEEIIQKAKEQGENEKRSIIEKSKEEIARAAVLSAEKILREK